MKVVLVIHYQIVLSTYKLWHKYDRQIEAFYSKRITLYDHMTSHYHAPQLVFKFTMKEAILDDYLEGDQPN